MDFAGSPIRNDHRAIIHFDYDCFYASVFEAKNPSLRSLPFAVQQKQIIVTCNYMARSRGLYKLQLVKDARRMCPDVIIELGEDISRFRDASKELYQFIKNFSWNNKAERLGFDEVWLDVTDMVDYNAGIINRNDLEHSFFQTSRDDPTLGFSYDASRVAGHVYPKDYVAASEDDDKLTVRLRLASHVAMHIRHELEAQKGYTSTVGIATNKLLSKLVGNLNKPKGQTTLMPPLVASADKPSNVLTFVSGHDIGKIPGIGFKLAQKIREYYLNRPASIDEGLVYGGTKERISVSDIREHPDVNPENLEKLLAGPGSAHGIGGKIWSLLHGVDDTEVSSARAVPRQISIEDSYIRLDTMPELLRELTTLACSLLNRMRIDLLGCDDDFDTGKEDETEELDAITQPQASPLANKKWLAHPKTLRLTTRPRMPLLPDGTRVRSFKRISHSMPLPNFVFNLNDSIEALAEKLVKENLVSMFRKLHHEKSGWNLSLVNLAVTNMAETASDSKTAVGRDIGNMFRKQDDVLKDFRVTDVSDAPVSEAPAAAQASDEPQSAMCEEEDSGWIESEGEDLDERCGECGVRLPAFAMGAHQRFHLQV
ncbi:Putative UmuC domain, DNA polymerase, Y-family, little finger domain, DNA/RNA polymerase superfamily [Septoria linicola]|uniref:UmuC domain, DNA polymerase, Y-family, little finger domain, DNA/RNA polymerase superfamily n=1 Tax=Septoria linicola TaxID=215465 RepID=A0A9Q9AL00_9PEZI|nr:Putative UmuC domain, DNA polymerase, Y-family, little finger domain, DNA/RNA polymerase superfamily [Septoria linicola]